MAQDFRMPPTGFGLGARALSPGAPDAPASPAARGLAGRSRADGAPGPARALLRQVRGACARAARSGAGAAFALDGLDAPSRAFALATLGEGGVDGRLGDALAVHETAFAGVWRVWEDGCERLEVGPAPRAILERAFEPARAAGGLAAATGPGALAAPEILAELLDAAARGSGHVVNLTLRPHTPEDLARLSRALGRGAAALRSRGYCDCRMEATATPRVWRVSYHNAMGALALDSFEAVAIPAAAVASAEDFADSAERLSEALEALR
jgi:hydrogenase-1 operon protein HyaF